MKGKGIKVFGVIMSLLLVFSFAATFSLASTSVVSAGTQKWTQISIPDTDDMQLAPGTDVGALALSPDGETLFAAVYVTVNTSLPTLVVGNWYVFKSVDDGYTWKNTGYNGDGTPTENIVAIKVSPDWVDDGVVVVATEADVYISEKRGADFISMGATGLGTITGIDVALDSDGDAAFVLGTAGAAGEVYLLSGFSGWTPQYIEDPDGSGFSPSGSAYDFDRGVLAVGFSPNYAEDGVIFAVVGGWASFFEFALGGTSGTYLRAESDTGVNNWGSYIVDAPFVDQQTGAKIIADSACMAFAGDYNSAPCVFVGLTAYVDKVDYAPMGDAFRVDLVMGTMGTSAVDDLNIRGENTRTNVLSLAVSGDSQSAFMLAGLRDLSNYGPMSTWQGHIHYSSNGGESWLQSYKPPSAMIAHITTNTLGHGCTNAIVMASDFSSSKMAYCSAGWDPIFGNPNHANYLAESQFGGIYVSTTQGTTWNGRGLLGNGITTILDVLPSPEYDTDSTLFMVALDPEMGIGLLWETKDGGSKWELILSMTLMIPLPGINIDKIEVPAQFPTEPSMFVTGETGAASVADNALIARTTDEGNLWASTLKAPFIGSVAQVVDAWKVIDDETLIVACNNKVWKTTDMGAHWIQEDGNNITDNVVDMQIWNDTTIIVGTDGGDVFICQNWETDFSFEQVDSGIGVAGDVVHVAFDANYDDNGMIYAGVNGSAAAQGVWRIDANGGDDWEQMDNGADDILAIVCDGNGVLWAIADRGATWGTPALQSVSLREVHPTASIDDISFEYVRDGLTSNLWADLETAPTQTYVFAIGGAGNTELWAYIDTLIKPTLISPANGATAAGTILQGNAMALVNLRWQEMPKATQYEYQVAYDMDFGSIAAGGSLFNTSATQTTIQLYLGELYYWRVRSVEPILSQWSDVWTFTTPLGPASSKPVITYPGSQDSHYDIPLKPTLTWTSAVECTGYELIVAKQCDWANPLINLTGSSALGTDTCYTITQSLQEDTNYCWKVRAINEDTGTASPWSDTGTFTTIVIEVEEEEGTPIWVWVVIALSAVLLVGVVVLIIRTRRPV